MRTVLEGSVRKAGNHLKITVQLVNAADGYHLWSETYDREMKDVFAIQEEIASAIVQRLEVTLDSEHRPLFRAVTDNLGALSSTRRGAHYSFRDGSISYARSSISGKRLPWIPSTPWHGRHWPTPAIWSAFTVLARPEACLPQAKEAAKQAIAFDPSLVEAHTSLAMCYLFHDWDRTSRSQRSSHRDAR